MSNSKFCATCGWQCTEPADCRINRDLARDGVDPSVYRNPLASSEAVEDADDYDGEGDPELGGGYGPGSYFEHAMGKE